MKIDLKRSKVASCRINIKKHQPYLDIDYEEMQNFNFVQSDEEEDNT